jgi:hypothetical protein
MDRLVWLLVIGYTVLLYLTIAFCDSAFWPSSWRLYRRWRGGVWYHVLPRPYPYIHFWTQDEPLWIEHVLEKESWA